MKENQGWVEELIEKLADLEHARWARWYLWQKHNSTPENIERWDRQARQLYSELSEPEKESDRKEVREYFPLIQQEIKKAVLE